MDITVTFQDAKWSVTPDPALVKVGENVTWLVRWPRSTTQAVRWAIYFTPFRHWQALTATTRNSKLGSLLAGDPSLQQIMRSGGVNPDDVTDHEGVVGPIIADKPGEYKYGISATNAETDEEIGDDDPKLIVRAR